MKRAIWVYVASLLGALVACGPIAPPSQAPTRHDPAEEAAESSGGSSDTSASSGDDSSSGSGAEATAPKGEDAKGLKGKINARLAPYHWGMASNEVFSIIDKQLDELYADRIEKTYNPKVQANLEGERDKKKKEIRAQKVDFTGGAVSGYEVKAPGEFTYKNNESAVEGVRPGGGDRILFFINDKLWKIYDTIPLTKGGELGDSFQAALSKLNGEFGEKGQLVAAKTPSASYYGTLTTTPARVVWFDGTTQIRLVDNTGRQDSTGANVALVYEEAATVANLKTLRTNVEKAEDNASVDAAAAATAGPAKPDDKKKKKK